MLTDLEAMRRAIAEYPEEDTPRHAYADCLQEFSAINDCAKCEGTGCKLYNYFEDGKPNWSDTAPCSWCDGKGRISNGYAERAELIRVQLGLPALEGDERAVAKKLEDELISFIQRYWLGDGALPRIGGLGSPVSVEFRRGMVSGIMTSHEMWCRFGDKLLEKEWIPTVYINGRDIDNHFINHIAHNDFLAHDLYRVADRVIEINDEDRFSIGDNVVQDVLKLLHAKRWPGTKFVFNNLRYRMERNFGPSNTAVDDEFGRYTAISAKRSCSR